MLVLPRFSFGVGDRFAHQASAQLVAFERLAERGVVVAPVWNKSNREHTFIGSEPSSVREAAARAVADRAWPHPWFVDADHVRLDTVDRFLSSSDFFTIDVAESIGAAPAAGDTESFLARHGELVGSLDLEGLAEPVCLSRDDLAAIARQYLAAAVEAGRIYRHIRDRHIRDARGAEPFVVEVSMDETHEPQTPRQLLVILAMLADEGIPVQSIAPKFTGRFNKGVDYVGDVADFEREFAADVAVVAHAVRAYGLPQSLKLSVHSGSDKFSLYPVIRRVMAATGAGVHLKTAGTTWLEELIGLAEAGGDGLALAREIYAYALAHVDELCGPYAAVIDIDRDRLPAAEEVAGWSGARLAAAIRHVPGDPRFDPNMRQLLHVSFKVAARQGRRYTNLLEANRLVVARQVETNIFDRHLVPLFLG